MKRGKFDSRAGQRILLGKNNSSKILHGDFLENGIVLMEPTRNVKFIEIELPGSANPDSKRERKKKLEIS